MRSINWSSIALYWMHAHHKLFCHFGNSYTSGMQDAEVTKSLTTVHLHCILKSAQRQLRNNFVWNSSSGHSLINYFKLFDKIKYTQDNWKSSSSGFLCVLFYFYFPINEATVRFLVARGNPQHPALNNSTASCKPKGKGDSISQRLVFKRVKLSLSDN